MNKLRTPAVINSWTSREAHKRNYSLESLLPFCTLSTFRLLVELNLHWSTRQWLAHPHCLLTCHKVQVRFLFLPHLLSDCDWPRPLASLPVSCRPSAPRIAAWPPLTTQPSPLLLAPPLHGRITGIISFIFLEIINSISIIEIKNLIKNLLSLNCQELLKIQKLILPSFSFTRVFVDLMSLRYIPWRHPGTAIRGSSLNSSGKACKLVEGTIPKSPWSANRTQV